MIARGYGLIAPEPDGSFRRRPAWTAMKTLIAELEGAMFVGTLPSPEGVWLYRFHRDGVVVVVAWGLSEGMAAELPSLAAVAISRDGEGLPASDGTAIVVGPSPVYYVLS